MSELLSINLDVKPKLLKDFKPELLKESKENESKPMISETLKERYEKQGYRIIGSHSAVKICGWTKKSMIDDDSCYKQKFYGISSHKCVQMTPSMACSNGCVFCWRDRAAPTGMKWRWQMDEPAEIIDGCLTAFNKLLTGFGGNKVANEKKYEESKEPIHFAISLNGDPILYPKISEMIDELHRRGISTFFVSRGQHPDLLKKLTPPTQLYLSLDAYDEDSFKRVDVPIFRDGWDRMLKSLEVMKEMNDKTRTSIRVTAIKGMNMDDHAATEFGKLLKESDPMFVEVKGYMFIGASRQRLTLANMPTHEEIKEFSEKIGKVSGYKIIDEQERSRVFLLMKEDRPDRLMKF